MCRFECTTVCLWRAENKFVESVISFCYVDSKDQSKILRPDSKCLHPLSPELSHWPTLTFR